MSGEPYPIKAAFVAFNNWLNQWPDRTRMCQDVLPRLDLLVTADLFMTETARWSDYVLPAAMLFEREDMVKGPGPYIQYQPAIVPPPGDCRSDLAIAAGLAERMGVGEYFARPAIDYLEEVLASAGPETAGLSAQDLRERGVLRKNVPDKPPVAHAERRFATPTGRIEFYVERLLPYGAPCPITSRPLRLIRMARWRAASAGLPDRTQPLPGALHLRNIRGCASWTASRKRCSTHPRPVRAGSPAGTRSAYSTTGATPCCAPG